MSLSVLLAGNVLDFYSALFHEAAVDYNLLEEGVFKHYNFAEEGYHKKYRDCKREAGESPE